MKTYQICNMILKLDYHYPEYLSNNIENYLIEKQDHVDAFIQTRLIDSIDEPSGVLIQSKNPFIIKTKKGGYFYIKNENNQVKALVTHDQHFKENHILINPSLSKDPAEIEYVLMSMIFMEIAARNKFLSLHASAFSYDNQGILISAPSQTGKSTLSRHFKTLYPKTRIINDDKPLLKIDDQHVFIYGTPFSGHQRLNSPIAVPLKAIYFLKQGQENTIKKMDHNQAFISIMKNMHRPMDDPIWDQMILIINHLMRHIEIKEMTATNSIEAAQTLFEEAFKGDNLDENQR